MKKWKNKASFEDFIIKANELLILSIFLNIPAEPEGMNTLLSKLGKGTVDEPREELPL